MNSYTNYVRWMINNQTPRPEPRDARTEWDEISAAQDLVENKITPEEERIERAYRRDIESMERYGGRAVTLALANVRIYTALADAAHLDLEKHRVSSFLDGRYGGLEFAYRDAAARFAQMIDALCEVTA